MANMQWGWLAAVAEHLPNARKNERKKNGNIECKTNFDFNLDVNIPPSIFKSSVSDARINCAAVQFPLDRIDVFVGVLLLLLQTCDVVPAAEKNNLKTVDWTECCCCSDVPQHNRRRPNWQSCA